MPLIKMFMMNSKYDWESDEYTHLFSGSTEWTEVSETDYEKLRTWANRQNRKASQNQVMVIKELRVDELLPTAISDYKTMMEKEEQAERKRKAAAAKRKATIAAKKKEKLKAQYEKLKLQFE